MANTPEMTGVPHGVQADPGGNTKAGIEAQTEINRQDWDLSWNTALKG